MCVFFDSLFLKPEYCKLKSIHVVTQYRCMKNKIMEKCQIRSLRVEAKHILMNQLAKMLETVKYIKNLKTYTFSLIQLQFFYIDRTLE